MSCRTMSRRICISFEEEGQLKRISLGFILMTCKKQGLGGGLGE